MPDVGTLVMLTPEARYNKQHSADDGRLWVVKQVGSSVPTGEPCYKCKSLSTGSTVWWFWDEIEEEEP